MDDRAVHAALILAAIGLMLAGALTNSWWQFSDRPVWSKVGLTEFQSCIDLPVDDAQTGCPAIKHASVRDDYLRFRKEWRQMRYAVQRNLATTRFDNHERLVAWVHRLDELARVIATVDVSSSNSGWILLGKVVYYGTFLAVALLGLALITGFSASENASAAALLAALACLGLFAVSIAFVYSAPDYIKNFSPSYSAGFSRWCYWAGTISGISGGFLLVRGSGVGSGTSDGFVAGFTKKLTRSRGESAKAAGGRTCPTCGATPSYREDVNCYICDTCRTMV